MHFKRFISMATVLASAMLSSGIAQGSILPQIVLTENSSTSLTATWNSTPALTVNFVAPDEWTISFTGTFLTTVSGAGVWVEPTGVNSGNIVTADSATDTITIHSDAGIDSGTGIANGTTDTTTFKWDNGTAAMDVTFIDNGDGGVPDATSTLALLSLSLVGLAILAKRVKAPACL